MVGHLDIIRRFLCGFNFGLNGDSAWLLGALNSCLGVLQSCEIGGAISEVPDPGNTNPVYCFCVE